MNLLKLNDQYYVGSDGVQLLLQEAYKTKKGETSYRTISYHVNLESVFKKVTTLNLLAYWPDFSKIAEVNYEILDAVKNIEEKIVIEPRTGF